MTRVAANQADHGPRDGCMYVCVVPGNEGERVREKERVGGKK